MKKRDFLLPLATLTAAVTATQVSASIAASHTDTTEESAAIGAQSATPSLIQTSEQMVTGRQGDNLFSFILRRGENGQMFAAHHSHSSHASHSSHSSHYSSR